MIINGMPIKFSQTIRIVSDWFKLWLQKPYQPNLDSKISFVYFSYEPDFEFLQLSLKSLVESVNSESLKNIYLFIDQKKPFKDSQIDELRNIAPQLITHPVYDFSWASTETTHAELTSFSIVSKDIDDIDMIAKVDSDILFFKTNAFDSIRQSKAEFIGDGHHVDYKYAQGGLYFIRNSAFKRVLDNVTKDKIIEAETQCNNKGEDIVISTLLFSSGVDSLLRRFMLFPDEYKKINVLGRALRKEFFALHFVKDKENMAHYYRTLIKKG